MRSTNDSRGEQPLRDRVRLVAARTLPQGQLIDFTSETFPTRFVVVSRQSGRAITSLDHLRRDDQVPSGGVPDALRKGRITTSLGGVAMRSCTRRPTRPSRSAGLKSPRRAGLAGCEAGAGIHR